MRKPANETPMPLGLLMSYIWKQRQNPRTWRLLWILSLFIKGSFVTLSQPMVLIDICISGTSVPGYKSNVRVPDGSHSLDPKKSKMMNNPSPYTLWCRDYPFRHIFTSSPSVRCRETLYHISVSSYSQERTHIVRPSFKDRSCYSWIRTSLARWASKAILVALRAHPVKQQGCGELCLSMGRCLTKTHTIFTPIYPSRLLLPFSSHLAIASQSFTARNPQLSEESSAYNRLSETIKNYQKSLRHFLDIS